VSRSLGNDARTWPIVVGALPLVSLLAVLTSCSGNGGDTPSYDSSNVAASWVDRTRGQSNALVAHDETICSTHAHELYCLDGVSGDEIFAEQLPGTATSPALAGETLVVGVDSGPGGVLYGYSLAGRQLWSLQLDGHDVRPWQQLPAGESPPVAGDVVAWVRGTGPSQELVAVDIESGREQWRVPAADLRAVFGDGHKVYTANDLGSLAALDPDSGSELWRAQIGNGAGEGGVVSLLSVLDGSAVAVATDGEPSRVVVVNAASGAQRWDEALDSDEAADVSVASANDVIYINDDDFVRAYEESGDVRWGAPAAGSILGPSSPVRLVAEHRRLFTIGDGVWDISINGGGGQQMRENVNASDIAVVEDHVIIAGATRLEAVPLVER